MRVNIIFILFLFGIAGSSSISCSSNIPDCPSKMCVISGGWTLSEVYVDDVKQTNDLSKYRLILSQPSPQTATTSTFIRTQTSGNQDDGSWSTQNNDTILRLIPGNDTSLTEDWIIENYSPRKLVLVINRDSNKQGPTKIEFVLEPF
jgi:hypothetical protein